MAGMHDGHRGRVKRRLETDGLDSFQPHEVLELLLFYAIPVRDVNELAHRLIARFGSLGSVLAADRDELMKEPGVGARVADWLKSAGAIVAKYSRYKLQDRPLMYNFKQAMSYVDEVMPESPSQQFWVITLTLSGYLTSGCMLYSGDEVLSPDCRVLFEHMLRYRTQNAIIVQRRLARDMKPGRQDCEFVDRLEATLSSVGILLMDQIFVCGHRHVSLRREGIVQSAVDNTGGINEGDAMEAVARWFSD